MPPSPEVFPLSPTRRRLLIGFAMVFVAVPISCLIAGICLSVSVAFVAAQEAKTFEVASVKLNTSGDGNARIQMLSGNRISVTSVQLRHGLG